MYQDRPQPGRGYLRFCGGLVALPIVVGAAITVGMLRDGAPLLVIPPLWVVILLLAALMLHMRKLAARVEYTITDGKLYVRCGWLFQETLPTSSIIAARRVRFIQRVLGWSFTSRGCCNRMTNGLLLVSRFGGKLYLSPSDIERFCAELGVPLEHE